MNVREVVRLERPAVGARGVERLHAGALPAGVLARSECVALVHLVHDLVELDA